MDVIQLPSVNRNYRILLDRRGRLIPHEIPEAEASFKLCKVTRKAFIRGGKIQLTFHDGKTLMGEFREFAPRDVVKLTLPELKVVERIPFGKDALALITGGSNVGKTGKIIEIKIIERAQSIVTLQTSDGSTFQAPEDYVFVIGRERPLISLEGAR
jgi:small subunit ribosomal protein S4e